MNRTIKNYLEIEYTVFVAKSTKDFPVPHIVIKKPEIRYDTYDDSYLITPYKQASFFITKMQAEEIYALRPIDHHNKSL